MAQPSRGPKVAATLFLVLLTISRLKAISYFREAVTQSDRTEAQLPAILLRCWRSRRWSGIDQGFFAYSSWSMRKPDMRNH